MTRVSRTDPSRRSARGQGRSGLSGDDIVGERAEEEPTRPASKPPRRRAVAVAVAGARWLGLSVAVGALAGIAAIAFYWLLDWATAHLLGGLVGFHPATVAGSGGFHPPTAITRPWLLPFVVAGGALLAAFCAKKLAPETTGHGTDMLIEAAHTAPDQMRARSAGVKMAAAAVTIGAGGSGGTEGPIAQIGGALGSVVARRARVPRRQARAVVLTGVAAGIGAIFRAPVGSAVIGAEMLYLRGLNAAILVPGLLASLISFGIFGLVHGYEPVFGDPTQSFAFHANLILPFIVLGVVCGLLGRIYAVSLYGMLRFTRRWVGTKRRRLRVPSYVPPAFGGLLVGSIGLLFPTVLGTSYGTAQLALDQRQVLALAWWTVLLLPVVKIAATSLSIGTGGSGGTFGPALVIGATAGCAVWRVAAELGLSGTGPAVFAIVGMAACLGPIVHAPVGVTILTFEATRSPELLLPTLLAVCLSTLIVRGESLYRNQRTSPKTAGDPAEMPATSTGDTRIVIRAARNHGPGTPAGVAQKPSTETDSRGPT